MAMKLKILGAGREVGRAAVALEIGEEYILFDYGVTFDERDIPQLPLVVPPSRVKALLVSHSHLDHIGAIPMLYISARPRAYASYLTYRISKVMLEDFLKLSSYYLPFEHVELDAFLDNVAVLKYNSSIEIDKRYTVETSNAGHIPGSMIFTVDTGRKRIIYTGDVNTIDTRLVAGADTGRLEGDVLIIEGTYGDLDHPDRGEVERQFIESIKEVVENGGTVLVPAFSLGRAQEILALLAEKVPYMDVKYDGMIKPITEIMLEDKRSIRRSDLLEKAIETFQPVRGWSERRKVWREPGVIVASAGMLKGGPSLYYIKRLASDKNSAVFLVSFQAPNTPGRMLLEEGTFMDKGPRVVARVEWFDFSSHAGVSGLLEIVRSVKNLERVIVIHSDSDTADRFVSRIREELGLEAYAPSMGESIDI